MELRKAVNLFQGDQTDTTRESYEYPFKYFVEYVGEKCDVRTILPEHLLEYQQKFLKKKRYAPATERKHVKTLKTFFNWLVKLGKIDKSPAAILKVKRLPLYVDRDKAITDDEYGLLLDYCRWKPRDYALLLFLADTGCRIGGAAGLKVSDLDLKNRRGKVTEKGGKTRPVRYGPLCAAAIAAWLLRRPRRSGPYVFGRKGEYMKPDNISLMIRRACRAVGIRVLSGHAFRHRKGHKLADQKTPITLAATILGHSDPMVTAHNYYPGDWESAERESDKTMTTGDIRPVEPKPPINLDEHQRKAK